MGTVKPLRVPRHSRGFTLLNYRDFIQSPQGTLQRTYQQFAMEYNDTLVQKVDQWINEHPKNKHGAHKYSAEEFGLNDKNIRDQFKRYTDSFAL